MIFKTCKISWLDPTILYQAQKLDSENYLRCKKWESLRFCSQNGHIITFEGKSFSWVSYKPFLSMWKWNSLIKTSNCGLLEGKLMPNMADPLKFDQIYPHFKHILGNILSKAVLRVRNYLKDDKSVTGEGQKVRVTSRALIYMRTRRARAL